jgi:hypothetical protein
MRTHLRAPSVRLPCTSALAATGLLALSLAACSAGGSSPSPAGSPSASSTEAGAVEHPTGAAEIVLRMKEGGGFVPMGYAATETPLFTLYGDGTVIYRPTGLPGVGEAQVLPPLRKARMSEAQIGELVSYALQAGLEDARERYENQMVADAPTTTFDIDAGGTTKSVSIYALGLGGLEGSGPDDPVLRGLQELAELLRNFENSVKRGDATDQGEYDPPGYRAVIIEGEAFGAQIDWPWDDLEPADFKPEGDMGFLSATVTPTQAKLVVEDPGGGFLGVGVTGPDGKHYTLALRPLLPDEVEA